MTNSAPYGVPQETLDIIKRDFLDVPLKDLPHSPLIPQKILDAVPRKHFDLSYASEAPEQKLDLYLPPETDKPAPVLAFIHGGGFVTGNKRDMQVTTYFDLLNHGYAVASIGYRFAPQVHYPEPIRDCKAAIRFLKAHGAEYGIDPARIAIAGQSAGGYYALMIAATPNIPSFEDPTMGNTAYDTTVRCAVICYPVTDFAHVDEQRAGNGSVIDDEAYKDDPDELFLGKPLAELDKNFLESASPIHYVSEQIPPIFLRHGLQDQMVPCQQSLTFAEKVRAIAGDDRIDLKTVEGAGHADPPFKQPSYLAEARAFLDAHMK